MKKKNKYELGCIVSRFINGEDLVSLFYRDIPPNHPKFVHISISTPGRENVDVVLCTMCSSLVVDPTHDCLRCIYTDEPLVF